jgi:hypothetical protein
MSILKFIRTDKCPICGCTEIVEEKIEFSVWGEKREIRRHINGSKWETRKFLCGYEINYSPNFEREEKVYDCIYNPEIKKQKQIINENLAKIKDFVNSKKI